MSAIRLTLEDVRTLSQRALEAHGTAPENAASVAASIMRAEAEGIPSHGLLRLPAYCEHVACGKVDGRARPELRRPRPGAVHVDARTGFAHPAIDLGMTALPVAARANGIGALAIGNSYNCGVVGDHVERLAEDGLVALGFVNAPAAIAPWGGRKALFGTDPIAFAAPRAGGPPLVIDQSSSVVARGEIMMHARQGKAIPEGWGYDSEGRPTTDPNWALEGSLAAAGGYKGVSLALMVEILAAGLVGANFGFEASSFATNEGGPPRTGQTFIALDPGAFGDGFADRVRALADAILAQPGTRLPGARRAEWRLRTAREGILVPEPLHAEIMRRIDHARG